MFWLKLISKFIKALRAGESPGQIAAGFSLGYLVGLMPFWTLQGVLILLVLILLNVNLAAGTVAWMLASLFALLLYPIIHQVGLFVLTGIPVLSGFWETLYNLPVVPLSRFNNTVVMGSLVVGLVSVVPVYLGMRKLVVAYRTGLEERINRLKIVQVIRGSKLVQWYGKIRSLGGE